ncbi:MAG: universal stress protein [Alphaproteobacteria bacterium]|nr:universal stress protein [Alphaproteobacteria bacterium]
MKHLMLATDLCANSDRAMERAIRLTKELDAHLYILHVISDEHKEPDDVQERASEIEDLIKSYIGDYKQAQGLSVAIDIIRSTKPNETICKYAAKVKAELIVMGMHRKARFMDMFMATTFSKILRECPLPVLMVKEKPVAPYQNILCGNDFAAGFYRSFEAAVAMAPAAHFEIMHAYEKPLLYPNTRYVDVKESCPQNKEDCEKAMLEFIDEQKRRYSEKYPGKEMDIDHYFVESDPYYALIEKTQTGKVELICVGTHGCETAKIGPVTNSLMADPPCDILVDKARDE